MARIGSSICVVGFSGLAAATVAAAVANVQPAIGIPMLGMFLGALTLGLPLLLVALWLSRAVPPGAIVACFAVMIIDFVGPELTLPAVVDRSGRQLRQHDRTPHPGADPADRRRGYQDG